MDTESGLGLIDLSMFSDIGAIHQVMACLGRLARMQLAFPACFEPHLITLTLIV